jgi:hypothetical protein
VSQIRLRRGVFRGRFFVDSQIADQNFASCVIDKNWPLMDSDSHSFSDPGLRIKTNSFPWLSPEVIRAGTATR